jgi:RNA polymerase sigma-70 factor (ECF subfamily)
LTTSRQQAEDLVQQAFVNVVSHLKNNKEIELDMLRAYIKKTIRNVSISNFRQSSAKSHLWAVEENEESPEAIFQNEEEKRRVDNAIAQLSSAQRTVVILHYFDRMTVEEISSELSISKSAVKTYLVRARKHLAQSIENRNE